LVGTALRGCPADLPWHRVIAAAGRIAFPPGSAGYEEQCRRLQDEGVSCPGGRIDLNRFGWQSDLDALLWGPAAWAEQPDGGGGAHHHRDTETPEEER
jgi:methylated-DNA-protein-cysteine methyltransferase-like protein